MRSWYIICPIYNPNPPVFQHPSYQTFHYRGLPQLQLIPTGTVQVTLSQPFHIHFFQTSHLKIPSLIHPLHIPML